MGKFKYEDHLETLGLCECLIALIQFEVKQGNKISGYDTHAKWPKEESHLIYLKQSLHLKILIFPNTQMFKLRLIEICILIGIQMLTAPYIITLLLDNL